MKHPILSFMVSATAVSLLSGCASKQATPSGFLGDQSVYRAMVQDPELEGVMVLKKTAYPAAQYSAFIVPPVSIYLNEAGQKRGVSEDDLRELADNFRSAVIGALGPRFQVTQAPAAGVAILRLAITDADPNVPLMNVHPGALALGGGLGGATAEAELIDSVSGKRVAAFLASAKGKRQDYTDGLTKWGHTRGVLENWAEVIGQRLNKGRG